MTLNIQYDLRVSLWRMEFIGRGTCWFTGAVVFSTLPLWHAEGWKIRLLDEVGNVQHGLLDSFYGYRIGSH